MLSQNWISLKHEVGVGTGSERTLGTFRCIRRVLRMIGKQFHVKEKNRNFSRYRNFTHENIADQFSPVFSTVFGRVQFSRSCNKNLRIRVYGPGCALDSPTCTQYLSAKSCLKLLSAPRWSWWKSFALQGGNHYFRDLRTRFHILVSQCI